MTPVSPELLADPPPGVIDAYGSLLKLDPADSLYLGSHDYEIYETKLLVGLCRPGDVAVDVGAMIGYYTLILAKNVGPGGRVFAFEPDPRNFELLSENVAMNDYQHVTLRQAVVGDRSGRTELFPASEEMRGDNRAYPTPGRDPVPVDMVALDDVVDGPVDIVKIDVQGFEVQVLDGMEDLIGRSKQLTMLVEYAPPWLVDAGTDPGDLLRRLRGLGFALFEIDEEGRQVRPTEIASLLARSEDSKGDLATDYTNLLCVKGQR